jgi:hypothetical protein
VQAVLAVVTKLPVICAVIEVSPPVLPIHLNAPPPVPPVALMLKSMESVTTVLVATAVEVNKILPLTGCAAKVKEAAVDSVVPEVVVVPDHVNMP